MSQIVCPNCGGDDQLRGERQGDVICVTCDVCGHSWNRDPNSPACPTCGEHGMRAVSQAVWERVRGNQLTTVALTARYLCPTCDAEKLRAHLDSGTPLPPDHNPASGMR